MNCYACGEKIKGTMIRRYHYKESGLDNVFLKDSVTRYTCQCGEECIEIPMIGRLQDTIAYLLLKKKALWNGREFRFLRKWAGLTPEELRTALGGMSRVHLSRLENEKAPITIATHHQMFLLILRIKEEAINKRMLEEIEIREFFETIRSQAERNRRVHHKKEKTANIIITPQIIKDLPFPSPKTVCA